MVTVVTYLKIHHKYAFVHIYCFVGPWSKGYQCGMRIPRGVQRVPTDADHGQFG